MVKFYKSLPCTYASVTRGYVISVGVHLLPTHASEQGNVIGLVSIYI